ncbi:MAG: MCE family protein [Bacteriovoracaceae bacterium]|nr:MCE family protein [Bacteriovoracaceae bacterium]
MNELKVGLITLAAIVSTVLVSLKITSNQSGFGTYYGYRTIINDASGIYPKTPIKVAGINAGRIKNIELQGTQALINFEVLEDVKITKNSVLQIKTVGFLGDKYLDIALGPEDSQRLKEGSLVPSKVGGGIEDVTRDISDVMVDVKEVVKKINAALEDDQKRNVVKLIVENIRDVTENLKQVTGTIRENDKNIDKMLKNLTRVAEQLAYETDRLEEGSTMNNIAPMVADARKTMSDIREVIADLKAGKGTVGKLLRDDEVVDQVSQTLSGINRLVNRINNIEAELALYSGVNTDNGGDTRIDIDLYPGPERFFRLGLVLNDYGPLNAEETETTETVGAVTTVTNKRVLDKDPMKINLQFGKRIQRWAFRAGLFETTGGVGVDYLLPHYGMRYSAELFDYQEDIGPNLRLITEFRFWNVMYLRLAGEDLISSESNQTFTISAGLRFTDQDLASLIALISN